MRARRIEHAQKATEFAAKIIREVEVAGRRPYDELKLHPLRVRHVVGQYKAPFHINISALFAAQPKSFRLDDDSFKGLKLPLHALSPKHFSGTKAMVSVFADGGCMFMGARSDVDLINAQAVVFEVLVKYMEIPRRVTKECLARVKRDFERAQYDNNRLFLPVDADYHERLIKQHIESQALVRHTGAIVKKPTQLETTELRNILALHTEGKVKRKRKAEAENAEERRRNPPKRISLLSGQEARDLQESTLYGDW